MILVERLFPGQSLQTEVWVSDSVREAIADYSQVETFLQKLEYWAKGGFGHFEGSKNPIRNERGGIFRVGLYGTLFRIYGFYEDARRSSFVAVTHTTKREQGLRPADKKAIKEAARIRDDEDWHRQEE
jgi:hypothetical protein